MKRRIIDFNRVDTVIIANKRRLILLSLQTLLQVVIGLNQNKTNFKANYNQEDLSFTVLTVQFCTTQPNLCLIAGFQQIVLAQISPDKSITKPIPVKPRGWRPDAINKICWVPQTDNAIVIMHPREIKIVFGLSQLSGQQNITPISQGTEKGGKKRETEFLIFFLN